MNLDMCIHSCNYCADEGIKHSFFFYSFPLHLFCVTFNVMLKHFLVNSPEIILFDFPLTTD